MTSDDHRMIRFPTGLCVDPIRMTLVVRILPLDHQYPIRKVQAESLPKSAQPWYYGWVAKPTSLPQSKHMSTVFVGATTALSLGPVSGLTGRLRH